MNEYCITYMNDNAEVFHCHVIAPNDAVAIEGAFRVALASNVALTGTTHVQTHLVIQVEDGLLASFEALRYALHGGRSPEPVQPSCTLH